jgi:hypothetical protein
VKWTTGSLELAPSVERKPEQATAAAIASIPPQ